MKTIIKKMKTKIVKNMKMKKSPNLAGELLHLPGEAATAIAAKLGPADCGPWACAK